MDEKFLFNTVIEKYTHPLEIEYLKKFVETGLDDYEEIIINTYCTPQSKVLIIGCGAGRESLAIAKKNFQVTGIDIVENLAKISYKTGKKESIRANFLTMNAKDMAFKSESFDSVILLNQVISLIPLRKNRIKTLTECRRVLKNNGTIIITTHSRNKNIREKIRWKFINFIRKIINNFLPVKTFEEGDKWVTAISGYSISKGKIFMHLYTIKEALEDIKTANLKIIDTRCSAEIVNQRECPLIREADKYIIYVAKKEE